MRYKKLIKDNGVIALFGQGMFTAEVMQSNKPWWKYNLIWDKVLPSGFLNANRMPLRNHKDIMIFYKKAPIYTPQKYKGAKCHSRGKKIEQTAEGNKNYGEYKIVETEGDMKYPKSILTYTKKHASKMLHPTEKSIDLCEWLIKSYTKENDLVLDNCMGVGTTGIACKNLNRKFIGMELDNTYYDVSIERINNTTYSSFDKGKTQDMVSGIQ